MAATLPAAIGRSLRVIYGEGAQASGQSDRYRRALHAFRELAGDGPASLLRAPGRVNLIGEHTDYNQGYVLPMALDKDTLLVARRRADGVVRLWNMESGRYPAQTFDLSAQIPTGPRGDWGNYVKAAAQAMYVRSAGRLGGMDMLVSGGAPWGTPRAAGLSSSSALLVVAALAFATLNGITLPKQDFARLCSEAEWYVGTRGGIMDHFISILAQRGHALLLDCRPNITAGGSATYHSEPVTMPSGCQLIICNSGVQRQKTRSQYNVRVAECRLAVTLLQASQPSITHLRDVGALSQVEALPERLGMAEVLACPALAATLRELNTSFSGDQVFVLRARARHVVSENARVLAGVHALRRGDAAEFGRLMNAAHESMSRDYEASCPEVDTLAQIARSQPAALGARVTGAGWGGCVVVLARDSGSELAARVAKEYLKATGLSTDIFACHSGPGACHVGDA